MRVLFIGERGYGGIWSYSHCLCQCLKNLCEVYCIGEDEPFAGRSGHDIREWFQIRRVIKEYKPDIIHINKMSFMMALYLKMFSKIPVVVSLHQPFSKISFSYRVLFWLLKGSYFLPVSKATWNNFTRCYPNARGEVFYNALRVNCENTHQVIKKRVIGMVGRNADQKDWPSFHKVADLVGVDAWNLGEKEFCPDAREKIGQMTVFVMTSKHEQLPTTMLECFSMKTAICGFIPDGGTSDVLQYSNGALKEVFIKERSCEKLAEIAKRLFADEELRKRVVEDGWRILTNHFDAEKNCRGQLMDIYRRMVK